MASRPSASNWQVTRFAWVPIALLLVAKIGSLGDFSELVPRARVLVYLVLFALISGLNIWRLSTVTFRPWSWRLMEHFPTYAAVARTIFCVILVIPVGSDYHSPFLPMFYLLYYGFSCSGYDHYLYHHPFSKGLRLAMDLLFACLCFYSYGGLRGPGWAAVLLPLAMVGRHYTVRFASTIALLAFVFCGATAINLDFHSYSRFAKAAASYAADRLRPDPIHSGDFGEVLKQNPKWEKYWTISDSLLAVGGVFLVILMAFRCERARYRRVLRCAPSGVVACSVPGTEAGV